MAEVAIILGFIIFGIICYILGFVEGVRAGFERNEKF